MYLESESDTDRDEEEKRRITELTMEIVIQSRKGSNIYLEDYKRGLLRAKHQLNLETLNGYKIETELDLRLCKYLGKVNVPGVSNTILKKRGLLTGGKLVGIKWDGN